MKYHMFELPGKMWRPDGSSQLCTQPKQLWNYSLKKHSGLNGIRTHDFCNISAVLYQLSYQANWKLVTWYTRRWWRIQVSIWNIIHLNCGKDAKTWLITCILHHLRVYHELTKWPAPRWLDSSVSRALHRCCWGHGFKSRSGLNFFRL